MLDYPSYILDALVSMEMWSPDQAEAYIEAFKASWGSYEPASLRRALREGSDHDRLFAVYALGATHSAEVRSDLLPLLESAWPLERWASALALGELREERALPVLWQMLTEMLPPETDDRMVQVLDTAYRATDYYDMWRPGIPIILGEWGMPESAPALRTGLQAAVRVELALDPADESDRGGLHEWTDYEDRIVYALGRLGGFGALAGIEGAETLLRRWSGTTGIGPPQTHLDQWRIHLVMGTLHGRYTIEHSMVWRWEQTPELLEEVTRLLERVFGLSNDEYAPAMQVYAAEMGFTLAEQYGWGNANREHHNTS